MHKISCTGYELVPELGQKVGQLISKSEEKLWDIDIENFTVSPLDQIKCIHSNAHQYSTTRNCQSYLNVMLRRIYRRPTTTNSSITGCCSRSSPSFSFAVFTPMSAICVAKRPKSQCRSSSVVGIGKGAHFLLRYYRIHLHLSLASHMIGRPSLAQLSRWDPVRYIPGPNPTLWKGRRTLMPTTATLREQRKGGLRFPY